MKVKLGDICSKGSSGIKLKELAGFEGEYPIYGASGKVGHVNFFHQSKPYVAVVKDGAGIGRTMLLPAQSSVIGTLQYLIPTENVLARYLYYAVKNLHLERGHSGSTIPHIYFRDYKHEAVRLRPLREQEHIIGVLGRLEAIINKRQHQLDNLDLVIKSQFIEMFGDVKTNPCKWHTTTLSKVIDSIVAGECLNGEQREIQPGERAVLKVSAVTSGYFRATEYKVLHDIESVKKNITPCKGDLLFSRANTRELVGATAIVGEDYPQLLLPDKLWKLIHSPAVHTVFLKEYLSMPDVRMELSASATGTSGSMYNISMPKLLSQAIYIPPLPLQNRFAEFVQQVDKSKFAIRKSLEKTQLLFDSLMQEYFG